MSRVVVATAGETVTLDYTLPSQSEDLGRVIGGVWLLKQTAAASEDLTALMEQTFTKVPSAVGFGTRVPLNQIIDSSGNLITTSTGLLRRWFEDLIAINTARGKNYIGSFRPINGQYCPPAWKAAMPAHMLYPHTDGSGATGIHPCYTQVTTHAHDGLPTHTHQVGEPNDLYEIRWRRFLQQLVALLNSDPRYRSLIRFVHGTYYSLDYSEYYNGTPTRSPAVSYSQAAHRNAHKRLATIMFEEMPDDIAVEWASTGHGPMVGSYTGATPSLGSNPFIEEMADHLVGLYGPGSDRVYFSMNGWSDTKIAGGTDASSEYNKQRAALTRSIRIELQDISAGWTGPWDAAFDWAIGGAVDNLGSYTGSLPPRRSLGKAVAGQPDRYLEKGVYPAEVYAFRAQGDTGNALFSAQLEPNAAALRAHVLQVTSR